MTVPGSAEMFGEDLGKTGNRDPIGLREQRRA
jgi:hypothetical protein